MARRRSQQRRAADHVWQFAGGAKPRAGRGPRAGIVKTGAFGMAVLFFLCLSVIAYVYFGYPLLLLAGALGRSTPLGPAPASPRVSVIVPAHNEESHIEAKVLNLLELDYPSRRVDILIGS